MHRQPGEWHSRADQGWAETILDYRSFYCKTGREYETLEPSFTETWVLLERAVLSHCRAFGPTFSPKACVTDLASQHVAVQGGGTAFWKWF